VICQTVGRFDVFHPTVESVEHWMTSSAVASMVPATAEPPFRASKTEA
jgi:hypothetical protein